MTIGLDFQLTMLNFQLFPTIVDNNWPTFAINFCQLSIDNNLESPGSGITVCLVF